MKLCKRNEVEKLNALGGKCTHIELGCNMMCILHLERFPAAVFYYLARRAHCDRTYRQYSSERPGPTALHSERTILLGKLSKTT